MTPSIQPEPENNSALSAPENEPGGAMTFFEHLSELRKRIINSLISVVVGALIGWVLAPHFVNWIVKPMTDALKQAHLEPKLVYSHPAGYLNLLITLSVYLGIVIASPWILYQIWLFVAPALYRHSAAPSRDFCSRRFSCFLPASLSDISSRCRTCCVS